MARKQRNERTSPGVARKAAQTLRNAKASRTAKSIAGSALTQSDAKNSRGRSDGGKQARRGQK